MSDLSHTGGWTVPGPVAHADDLTMFQKVLFGRILALTGEECCWASNGWLAEEFDRSTETIRRHIATLIDRGYLLREVTRDDDGAVTGRNLYPLVNAGIVTEQGDSPIKTKGGSTQNCAPVPTESRGHARDNDVNSSCRSTAEKKDRQSAPAREDNAETSDNSTRNNPNYKRIKEIWNAFAEKHGLSPIRKLMDSRKRKIRVRWNEWEEEGDAPDQVFIEVLLKAEDSPFLLGERRDSDWTMDFDWLIRNDKHWVRVLEGVYQDDQTQQDRPEQHDYDEWEPVDRSQRYSPYDEVPEDAESDRPRSSA